MNAEELRNSDKLHHVVVAADTVEAELLHASASAANEKRERATEIAAQIRQLRTRARELEQQQVELIRQGNDLVTTALRRVATLSGTEIDVEAASYAPTKDGSFVVAWPKAAAELDAEDKAADDALKDLATA